MFRERCWSPDTVCVSGDLSQFSVWEPQVRGAISTSVGRTSWNNGIMELAGAVLLWNPEELTPFQGGNWPSALVSRLDQLESSWPSKWAWSAISDQKPDTLAALPERLILCTSFGSKNGCTTVPLCNSKPPYLRNSHGARKSCSSRKSTKHIHPRDFPAELLWNGGMY